MLIINDTPAENVFDRLPLNPDCKDICEVG